MFSRFFIDRPIFAFVLSIFIVLAGLASMVNLPIAQYPEIAPPVVLVNAFYPGASAQVIEQTVASPLENAINGVEGMMYMASTSNSNGAITLAVTFEIGTDIDKAELAVNNRIKQAEARLPLEVRRQGITVQKGSAAFLAVLAFYSPDGRYDDLFTSNYVTLNVLDQLKRIPGTTGVQIFGAKDYAMRIWLKPDRMTQLGVTVGEVAQALNEQNAQYAAGKIGQPPYAGEQELVYTVTTRGRLSTAEEFGDVILRANPDGTALRIKDIARVELGSRDYDFIGTSNGRPATLMGVFLQAGANSLAVGDEVKATLERLKQDFPPGLEYSIPYDTTRFVEVSIEEVVKTLVEAMILVFLVVFLFLQNWRATLIPTLAVPVSLIGTFAGLLALGYSINTLTLFGMVLSIGIVVDDAIVVLENVERIMHEERVSAREAAFRAMEEVSGPVIAIVLVLCAVFVPIAFLGGLTGELYRQFAITVSISVVLSGVVALTMTPAMCVLILRHEHKAENAFFSWFNRSFAAQTRGYVAGVRFLLRRAGVAVLLFLAMVGATIYLWQTIPGSLIPDEDQGYYVSAVYLPEGASLARTQEVTQKVVEAMMSNPANQEVAAFAGFDFLGGGYKNSAATIFTTQRHWREREMPTTALVGEIYQKTAGIKEALVLAFNPPPITGLSNTGGFELYIQNRGEGGPAELAGVANAVIGRASQDPALAGVATLWRVASPQIFVDVDRNRARALGVSIDEAFNTVAGTLGSYYVNDFNKYGRTWQVLMSADASYRQRPEDIGQLYVRSMQGQMVPLSAFSRIIHTTGPDSLDRFNNLPAVKILGQPAPGYSSGQALAAMEKVAAEVLPAGYTFEWSGTSFQEKRASGSSIVALALAALMVFLILAALYERWTLPLSVLLALPFGTFGALAAIYLRGFSNDVYFQIGLVTLLGLAAKNAILIVEYALFKKQEGWTSAAAALEAARLRFRPIIMTSLAFILGVVPLAISTGAGAGARQAVGTGVMGGMLAATFLAVFFVPFFFKLIVDRRFTTRPAEFAAGPAPEASEEETHV